MTLALLTYYARLIAGFRNGGDLVRTLRGGPPCDEAVLRDGTRIAHPPGRPGLVELVVELWLEQAYTRGGFYSPRAGDVVVDAGANVGLFSIWLARRGPGARVVALEPFAENFAQLQANLRVAGLGPDRVEPRRMALGAAVGAGTMVAVGDRSLDHTLRLGDGEGLGDGGAEAGDAIPVVPLAGLLDLARADRLALLKVDVEGSERDAFETVDRATLERFDRIAIEYHDNLRPGTLALLKDRLAATHVVESFGSSVDGCGIVRAARRKS